jgi:hypothetical protein
VGAAEARNRLRGEDGPLTRIKERFKVRLLRHDSGVQGQKKGPCRRHRSGARCARGKPSAWIALIRWHAGRAGFRFFRPRSLYRAQGGTQRADARQEVTRSGFQKSSVKIASGTPVASRGPPWRRATPWVCRGATADSRRAPRSPG